MRFRNSALKGLMSHFIVVIKRRYQNISCLLMTVYLNNKGKYGKRLHIPLVAKENINYLHLSTTSKDMPFNIFPVMRSNVQVTLVLQGSRAKHPLSL